jgi:hypothetical protein
LNKFREDVTGDRTSEHPDSIPGKAIRPIGTLHLTIGVMSLLSQEKINDAVDFLKKLNLKDLLSDRENRDSLPLDQTNRAGHTRGAKSNTSRVEEYAHVHEDFDPLFPASG